MALLKGLPSEQEMIEILSNIQAMEEVEYLASESHKNPELLLVLWKITLRNEHPYSWHAIWVFKHATKKRTDLLQPFATEIYELALTTPQKGIHRELLSFINLMPLNEEYAGLLLEKCIEWVNGNFSIAVKARCFHFFINLLKLEPELASEFEAIAQQQLLMNPSSGLKNTVNKLLKATSKLGY